MDDFSINLQQYVFMPKVIYRQRIVFVTIILPDMPFFATLDKLGHFQEGVAVRIGKMMSSMIIGHNSDAYLVKTNVRQEIPKPLIDGTVNAIVLHFIKYYSRTTKNIIVGIGDIDSRDLERLQRHDITSAFADMQLHSKRLLTCCRKGNTIMYFSSGSALKTDSDELRVLKSGLNSEITHASTIEYYCNHKTCNSTTTSLKLCSICRIARYCSKKCQTLDWPKHVKDCIAYVE